MNNVIHLATLRSHLYIRPTTYHHYLRLADYHYIKYDIRPYKFIFGAYGKGPYRYRYPRPIAVVVYAPPLPNLAGRNVALRDIIDIPSNPSERMKVLNKYFIYISRLICDPRFTGQGISSWLCSETFDMVDYPIIESLAPICDGQALCRRIGFSQEYNREPVHLSRVRSFLVRFGISPAIWDWPWMVQRRIDSLPDPDSIVLEKELLRFVHHYSGHYYDVPGLHRTTFILSKLFYPSVYHYHVKPSFLVR